MTPENKAKLQRLAERIEQPLREQYGRVGEDSTAKPAEGLASAAADASGTDAPADGTLPAAGEAEPPARQKRPAKKASTALAIVVSPPAPEGERPTLECQYCGRETAGSDYSTVLPSGKCRCRECARCLARDRHARNELGDEDCQDFKQLSMQERMAWHRENVSLALRALPHALSEHIAEKRSTVVTRSHFAGGPMLDAEDLAEKYKDKPDQLENIKKYAYTCTHPTRKVQVWEDVELKRLWQSDEGLEKFNTREAAATITVKPKRQAKPLQDGKEKKVKPALPKQAKPLGRGLQKQRDSLLEKADLGVATSCQHISSGIDKGVPVPLIKKMQELTDKVYIAANNLRIADTADEAKECIVDLKIPYGELLEKSLTFCSTIEMMYMGSESDIALSKGIQLCEAEKVQQNPRIVLEG